MPEQVKPTQRPRSKSSLSDKETHITFWKLFKNELRKNLDSKPERTTPDLKYIQSLEHLTNLYTVPFYLEQFMSFGLVYCLNSFLTLLTIIPLRVLMVSILKLRAAFTNSVPGRYRFKREDVTWILLLLSSSIAISSIDTSKIYHNIKAGTVIKLYVMVSVLEVADKLLSSLGQDILRVSFNFPLERSLSCAGKCFLVALLSTTYISVHACVFVYQIMSLNVAVNSYSNALLTLLLSVQFAEIKSAVFKRLEREGLFQMACADLYERFQLFLMLFIISVRNLVQLLMSTEFSIRSRSLGENIAISPVVISWIGMLMGPSFAVIGSELLVDWLKHLYIGKFNRIKPQIYRRYTRILSQDFLREYRQNDPDCTNPPATTESFATMNIRLGLPLLPITVAFCKMVISSVRKACSTQNFDQSVLLAVASAAVILILLRMSTYVMLIRWARHNTRAKTSPSGGDYLKGSPNTSLAGIEDIHTRSLLYGSDEKMPQSKEEQRSHNANRDGDKSLAQWLKFYSMRRLGQVAITLVLLNLFVFLGYKFTPSTVIGSPSWEPAVVPTVFNESYLDSLQFTDINVDSFLSDTNGRISVTCDSLAYKGLVKTSKKKELDCDMAYIRRKIFSSEEYGVLADLEAQDITEEQRIKKHWFTFYGSSVYLPEHEVHYLVRRVLFSKVGRADTPVISLLVAQLYDKDWNELTPHTLEIVNPATGNVTPQTFPQLIHVPIEWSVDDKWKGTEDPRVFLKPSKTGVSEPIVLFNLQSSLCDGKRGMFVTSPFRSDKVNLLDIEDKERPNSEKNWSPFFLDDVEVSKYSTGYVHFVYSFNPLKVIKCSLDTGACRMIYESPEEGRFGSELRGATPMVKLPVHLSLPKGKEVWVAFPRTRLRDCGCSRTTYRPVLTLFVKEGNKFYTELISSSIDFHIDVLSYDAKGESCSGSISVLIPNGIDSWDVSKKQGGKSDILTLTLSEADRNTVVVHVKGLLDYLLVLNGEGPIHDSHSFKNVLSTNHFKSDTTLLNSVKAAECAIFSSRDYCKKYGETRGEPARYAKQMENERKEKEKKEKEAKEKLEAEKAEMEEAVRKAQEAIAQKEREKEEAEQEKKAQQEAKEKEAEEKAAKEKEAKENEAKKKIIVEKLAKEQEEAEKLEAKKKLYQLQEEERS